MMRIAVTGGIGTGKTAATDHLIRCGFTVLDADQISRGLTAPGGGAIPYIRRNFGDDFILPDGSLDRRKMRELVFQDAGAKALLEEGTTRIVIEEMERSLNAYEEAGERVVFASVPLLFEFGMQDSYDESWLVTADRETRIRRVMKRDGLTEEMVRSIIESQMPEEKKRTLATRVIDNSGSLADLYASLDEVLVELNLK